MDSLHLWFLILWIFEEEEKVTKIVSRKQKAFLFAKVDSFHLSVGFLSTNLVRSRYCNFTLAFADIHSFLLQNTLSFPFLNFMCPLRSYLTILGEIKVDLGRYL